MDDLSPSNIKTILHAERAKLEICQTLGSDPQPERIEKLIHCDRIRKTIAL